MKSGSVIERVLSQLERAMPGELAKDLRENVRVSLQSVIAEMDLVTREEFEIQRKMLDKAIARVDALQKRIEESEQEPD